MFQTLREDTVRKKRTRGTLGGAQSSGSALQTSGKKEGSTRGEAGTNRGPPGALMRFGKSAKGDLIKAIEPLFSFSLQSQSLGAFQEKKKKDLKSQLERSIPI